MPMFKALKLCPDAEVVKPRMDAYSAVSQEIRARMLAVTPMVEPLSLDEAFLDLSGTERVLGMPPAATLALLAKRIEEDLGVTVSVGLSHSKYLAKIASDLDKPRGFSVVGRKETVSFLSERPVRSIWGVGAELAKRLEADGLKTNADLRRMDAAVLMKRYGQMGKRLHELSNGVDTRRVSPNSKAKSISSETTFNFDTAERDDLVGHLWRLAVRTSDRAKAKSRVGGTVTLKLKTANFRTLTRQVRLEEPTNLADVIYSASEPLLIGQLDQGPFRLIGVGISDIAAESTEPLAKRLFEDQNDARARAERASDSIRAKFGTDAIRLGRTLR